MPEGMEIVSPVVEVFADPICPWCLIGKRRLALALQSAGGGATIRWRAFQLNPSMRPEGMDRGEYLATKFGGADRARHVYDVIRREGEADGIAFAFARIRRTPSTVQAHRLVRFAAHVQRDDAVMDGLFNAYFLEGRDIGDRAELASIAAAAGCDGDAAARFLSGNEERDAVVAEDSAARIMGIGGVPHFIVGGRYQLSGAQSPEVIVRAIELARADLSRRVNRAR